MSDAILQVSNLEKHFRVGRGKILRAVDNVSFAIQRGKTLGLVGESGCGKTTVGRTLLRIYEPDGGTLVFDGQDISKVTRAQAKALTRKMQMIFQDPYASLNPFFTVGEIIAEGLELHKLCANAKERRERVYELLNMVGLSKEHANRFPHEFSGGQRQRVGIAQALLGDPEFLIFDEPTVGLDPEERIHFRNLFSQTAQDRLVLLSTHIIEDVQSVCGQLVVMDQGRVLFTGTPEALIQSAAGHVGVFWEREAAQEAGLHITARVNTSQGIRYRAVADVLPRFAQPAEPTLEDAYLYLISREAVQ